MLNRLALLTTMIAGAGLSAFSAEESASSQWQSLVDFPMVAWIGPAAPVFKGGVVQDFVDAGMNVNCFAQGGSLAANLQALDAAQLKGVKMIIEDERYFTLFKTPAAYPADLEKLDKIIDDYKDHPAYLGFFVDDEPHKDRFDVVRMIKDRILKKDPKHLAYINSTDQWAKEEWVNEFMDRLDPQVLSFDTYPITRSGCEGEYFKKLDIFRRVALKRKVPMWAFSMLVKMERWPLQTGGAMAFQQYSNLAYGAHGLQYFTYANVAGPAAVEANGDKTPQYFVLKKLNAEITKIAPLLKGMTSLDVTHSLPLPSGTKGFAPDSPIRSTTGDPILAGWFTDNASRPYVLLVNREYLFPGKTRLFTKQVAGLIEVSKQTGAEIPAVVPLSNNITLDFAPGEGRLFRIVTGAPPDAAKLSIDSVDAMPPDSVEVVFSEKVERQSAENAANYAVDGGIQVTAAHLLDDGVTVLLRTSPLTREKAYTLQARNIQNVAGRAVDAGTRTFKWSACVLDWSFDEGAEDIIHDRSGNNNVGYRYWEAEAQDGKIGKALNFTGGSVTARPAYFSHITNSFTTSLWVKPAEPRGETPQVLTGYNYGYAHHWGVTAYDGYLYGAGHAGAGILVGNNGVSVCENESDVPHPYHHPTVLVHSTPITDWTHVAVVYDNKQTKLYLNGVLAKTGLTSIKTVHPSAQIGVDYKGGIDEFKIFSYALSQDEIAGLMKASAALPSTDPGPAKKPK
jgi:hypothetical protein